MVETEKRQLGSSQIEVSAMGVGTWAWGDKGVWGYGKTYGLADVQAAYKASLDAGFDFFDTAEIYGNGMSEKILNSCIHIDNRHAVIATKFAPLPFRFSAAELTKALDASLQRLGLETVDLYQIHWPFTLIKIEDLMDVMAKAQETGKIRAIGVSNFTADQMKRAQARLAKYNLRLASNQVHYSLLHRKPETNEVLNTCRQLDIALIAYSPLEQGLLTGKFGPSYKISGTRRLQPHFRQGYIRKIQPLIDTMRQVAQAHDKTVAQVALRWLLQRDQLVIPIPGAKNSEQATQNAGAMNWQMSDTEFEQINLASHAFMR